MNQPMGEASEIGRIFRTLGHLVTKDGNMFCDKKSPSKREVSWN